MTENEVTIDGVRYVAVGMPLDHGCEGCVAHLNGSLCGDIHDSGARCGFDSRKDGREVIWQIPLGDIATLRELNRELVEGLEYCVKNVPEFLDIPGIASVLAKARGEK